MNYVAFSLWSGTPKFTVGAIKNAALCRMIYPGWQMVVWHDSSVPESILNTLRNNGVMLKDMSGQRWCSPSVWRFLVNDLQDCERYVVRDCDSRPCERERWAVDRWMESGRAFHIIRDHPFHGIWPVQAGMFGSSQGFIQNMEILIRNYHQPNRGYGFDQDFLRDVIWPKAQTNCIQHDGGCNVRFPGIIGLPPKNGLRFIGERFDENDQPNEEDLKPLRV